MRNCIEFLINGLTLRGTHHSVASTSDPTAVAERIGVLMLNFGFAPRASLGDVTVHQSDHIAKLGYPVFRFDLPGLGDSDGDLPENAMTILQIIQQGEHAPFTCQLIAEIKHRFKLDSILLAGHCGGAITAIYAADQLGGKDIVGMMIYEPDFILRGDIDCRTSRLEQLHQEVRVNILGSKIGHISQALCARLKRAKRGLKSLKIWKTDSNKLARIADEAETGSHMQKSLPARANLALIHSFQRVMRMRMRILVVAVPDRKTADNFDYVDFLLSDNPPNVASIVLRETNHSFVEGNGEQALMNCTERWLLENFPISTSDQMQSVLD